MLYKQDEIRRQKQRNFHIVMIIVAAILSAVIIWVDITTGFWGDTVILSGLAAGLLMYFATVFIGNRITHQSEVEDWMPLTRLALTDILHELTVNELSEGYDGHVVSRVLTAPEQFNDTTVSDLNQEVIKERQDVNGVLAKWATYLVTNADVQDLLLMAADTGEQLDDVRVAINKWRATPENKRPAANAAITKEINEYNRFVNQTVKEAQRILMGLHGQNDD